MKKQTDIAAWIITKVIAWRVALLLVGFLAIRMLVFKESFPYWETLLEPEAPAAIWGWGNFDGVHYLTIAKSGYSAQYTQAFFPLYPLLIGFVNKLSINYFYSGLIISNISFIFALYFFYKLIRLDYGDSSAKRSLIYLMLFPTSFFFGAIYTESIFLMFVFASLYAARRKKWWIAGLMGALASATRLFGILLLPILLIEWFMGRGRKISYTISELFQALLPIILSASGLLIYMRYLNNAFSDPLYFIHAQPAFGAQRSGDKIILLYQVFWRYIKMLWTVDKGSLLYYTVTFEAISGLLFLILVIYSFKKTRTSYALFALFSYLLPTLTGTLSSMPRYVLILFPCFMLLGRVQNKTFYKTWWLISAILLVINTALFLRGYWIA